MLSLYQTMYTIRRVEESLIDLFHQKQFPGYLHSSIGQEACAAGVCGALRTDDYMISTHRPRAHLIAKGMELKAMIAEMLGRVTGVSRGRGGEMHAADPDQGILGGNGIVGGGIPISIGTGFSSVMRGTDQVTAVFFGEGAANTGGLSEAMNLAAAWSLPVLFICENNLYMQMCRITDVVRSEDFAPRALGYDIPGTIIDGNDVAAVYAAARDAAARARSGSGPEFLELKTYRWGGHFEGDPCKYRTREEERQWQEKCPVRQGREALLQEYTTSADTLEQLETAVNSEIAGAIRYAQASPWPEAEDALNDVFAQ